MKNKCRLKSSALVWAMLFSVYAAGYAQTGATHDKQPAAKKTAETQALPRTTAATATGTGTGGQLTKWLGFGSSSVIGDSSMTEDKAGKIGIGTTSPTSALTVKGTIETTLGGYKFPDGSIQTTAAVGTLSSVFHDATLKGDGTGGSPLGVAVPIELKGTQSGPTLLVRNQGSGEAVILVSVSRDALLGKSDSGKGVAGDSVSGFGVDGQSFTNFGVFGHSTTNVGVEGFSINFDGVHGRSEGGGLGVRGDANTNAGVLGTTQGAADFILAGVSGVANTLSGVAGSSSLGSGILGISVGGNGVEGRSTTGKAGQFNGNVEVTGTLSKGGGMFHIDHPLDPENKFLNHSFVESPDMMNIYNGNATTDEKGEIIVRLPEWFGALNRDFRYQLTVIGQFAQAIVASEMKDNQFSILTSIPNVKVSWQVTGIRHDAWANKHRIQIEENKPDNERGFYLHPEAHDQPEEKGIEWARHPETMQRVKEMKQKNNQ